MLNYAPQLPENIRALCERLAQVTYENLTKIIHLNACGNPGQAQRQENALQHDLDHWMGGGTCYSLTWHLYKALQELGYAPRLVMGHKRIARNVHCALTLAQGGVDWFLDPGYLIFDPLAIPVAAPLGPGWNFHPLIPNWVRLEHGNGGLGLWTGSGTEKPKLRFEFPLQGVDENEFHRHWVDSFSSEMMQYPVLNRLDRHNGIQYYYQKGNLLVRDAQGSRMEKIAPDKRVEVLATTFGLSRELLLQATELLQ